MRKRLLIVDDEESILVGMKRFLQARGYDVDCAREREEAEALVGHVRYDCVVADLCLTPAHGADGLDVIDFVKAHSPSTRVMVLTAYGTPAVEAEALRLGADRFLRKPQPMPEVEQVIGELIGKAH